MAYGSPPPPSKPKKKTASGKLSDKQKADLKKHMDKLNLSGKEKNSHRMKMMSRMKKGMSVSKAHKDIMK